MRRLIHVPILHSEVDLGSLGRRLAQTIDGEAWARRRRAVAAMWRSVRSQLLGLSLVWDQVKIYQDGLPVSGHEHAIVRDLANQGSENHRLLLELIERGATLVGTENPEHLIAEYFRMNALLEASEVERLKIQGEEILRARDLFVAERIDRTLLDGETAILFIGLLHKVDALLKGKMKIRTLRSTHAG